MPLALAIAISLVLHAAAVFGVAAWPTVRVDAPQPMQAELRIPEEDTSVPAERVATRPPPPEETTPPPPAAPSRRRPDNAPAMRRAQAALAEHLFYPPAAVERGLEGEVILLLTLDARGRVIDAQLARSSGHAILDQAALDAARRIGALPGNPRETLLPVNFRLN